MAEMEENLSEAEGDNSLDQQGFQIAISKSIKKEAQVDLKGKMTLN